jgi:hypothetical protein
LGHRPGNRRKTTRARLGRGGGGDGGGGFADCVSGYEGIFSAQRLVYAAPFRGSCGKRLSAATCCRIEQDAAKERKAQAYERAKLEKKTHNFPLALPDHLAEQANELLKSTYNLEFLGLRRAVRERELAIVTECCASAPMR